LISAPARQHFLNIFFGEILHPGLPKDKIKLRETGRQVEKLILDARFRRKKYLENVAERVQKSRECQADVIRMNKYMEIRNGKSACLGKMEGQQKQPCRLIKREVGQQTHPDRLINRAEGQQINPDRLINSSEGQQINPDCLINRKFEGQHIHTGRSISRKERQQTNRNWPTIHNKNIITVS
jgi:hypothetical protein